MKIEILAYEGVQLAEIIADEIVIHDAQDILDIMASSDYMGSRKLLIRKAQLVPDFFELKSGIAGDVLQKFSNYDAKCAIIGHFDEYNSKSLKDFMRESNRTGRIFFVETREEAIRELTRRK